MSNYRDNQVHMIADYEGDVTELIKDREKGIYPILCTRDLVLFPTVLTPIILGRSQSIAVLEHFQQQKKGESIFCAFAQKDSDEENPTQEDLYEIGVFCRLITESEVASINMLYGGGGSGKRVMTSSSSPGVSLMQEGISYMAGAEVPGLIVDVQRGGPPF